jgi:hypothetical protein
VTGSRYIFALHSFLVSLFQNDGNDTYAPVVFGVDYYHGAVLRRQCAGGYGTKRKWFYIRVETHNIHHTTAATR